MEPRSAEHMAAQTSRMHFSEVVTRHAETINTLERLLVETADTLTCLAKKDNKGFFPFVREEMVWVDLSEHPTTSAQCICALQDLIRIIGSVKLRTHESPNLPFQKVPERGSTRGSPKTVLKTLGTMLPAQIENLNSQMKEERVGGFGKLNPFTCAHVFRALAPNGRLLSPICSEAFFGILWALGRKYPYGAKSGASMPESLPTTFVTSLCIDAVESLADVLKRRRERFQHLIDLVKDLEKLGKVCGKEEKWKKHKRSFLYERIMASLQEMKSDAVLKILFEKCYKELMRSEADREKFTSEIIARCFGDAVKSDSVHNEIKQVEKELKDLVTLADKHVNNANAISKAIISVSATVSSASATEVNDALNIIDILPWGVVDKRYREATKKYLESPCPLLKSLLEEYWGDHCCATADARVLCVSLADFLRNVIEKYQDDENILLSVRLQGAADGLNAQVRGLHKFLDAPIRWCETVMDHQLTLARSGYIGNFDGAELAHAARVVVRSPGLATHASAVLQAIKVVCEAQHADGNWSSAQPFYWTAESIAAFPHSAEVAWALVSIMATLTRQPHLFGMSQSEMLEQLQVGNEALQRFLHWLTTNARSYSVPELLRKESNLKDEEGHIFGWGSDRTPEPSLVQSWATANVAEFLMEFRSCLQEQVNVILRVEFLSYHPNDLHPLDSFSTPDLHKHYKDRIVTKWWHHLNEHAMKTRREEHWMPDEDYESRSPDIHSAVLAGPPGTAKSYLAERIAGELKWPLISLSPSDFLAAGEGEVEKRARQIFDALSEGSRLVYFFDEIDELILDRAQQRKESSRSVFSFLTPGFLTKLQDLRKAATQKSFIFLIGTNYVDRIDPAAIRTGRIDKIFPILYPDQDSRLALIQERFDKQLNDAQTDVENSENDDQKKSAQAKVDAIQALTDGKRTDLPKGLKDIAEAAVLLSIPGLIKLCDKVIDRIQNPDWWGLKEELDLVRKEKSDWVRREVDLVDLYAGRTNAVNEWMNMLWLLKEAKEDEKKLKNYLKTYITLLDKAHRARVFKVIDEHKKGTAGWSGMELWSKTDMKLIP